MPTGLRGTALQVQGGGSVGDPSGRMFGGERPAGRVGPGRGRGSVSQPLPSLSLHALVVNGSHSPLDLPDKVQATQIHSDFR